jgi:hypothetical protein
VQPSSGHAGASRVVQVRVGAGTLRRSLCPCALVDGVWVSSRWRQPARSTAPTSATASAHNNRALSETSRLIGPAPLRLLPAAQSTLGGSSGGYHCMRHRHTTARPPRSPRRPRAQPVREFEPLPATRAVRPWALGGAAYPSPGRSAIAAFGAVVIDSSRSPFSHCQRSSREHGGPSQLCGLRPRASWVSPQR